MRIIGLSGYARSGKSEAAAVLTEVYGFTAVAYADKLRDFLYAQNPDVKMVEHNAHLPTYTPLQMVIDEYGWEGYKKSPYGDYLRELIQRTGTEAGRGVIGDTVWIDSTLKPLEDINADVVVTDCRFPNEANAIRERGGKVLRISRTGNTAANAHPSEIALDDYLFDRHIANTGSLDDFHNAVRVAMAQLKF